MLKTEYSPLLEKPDKIVGDDYHDVEEAKLRRRDGDEAEEALLGESISEESCAPDGGWGWMVTLAAFVIWVRLKQSLPRVPVVSTLTSICLH